MKYDIISERTAKYEVKVSYPSDLYPSLKRYATKKKEYFYVCSLDASNSLIKINMISVGILNRALIHPREVFRAAIKDNSASIILVHNHPSGELEPSFEDREVTKRLVQAGVSTMDSINDDSSHHSIDFVD
ncbi:MAG: hypothetical protein B6229_03790 [Spirochaetaceae bacterium 4572_7]|nr:MAG: hypothetical protein B6229_03790 [Spirochaetaceae bacterium 4572_7]